MSALVDIAKRGECALGPDNIGAYGKSTGLPDPTATAKLLLAGVL